nr:glycoside hydrolase family 5 subfamily 2 [Gaurotes virginea]
MNPSCLLICLVTLTAIDLAASNDAAFETVSKHGHLSVVGPDLVNKNGDKVQLKGMALYWSQWKPQYWNAETVAAIHNTCHSNVVRASMGVDTVDGGYLTDPDGQMALVETVVEAAIANDLYIIVDWHEEHADRNLERAKDFFDKISKKYGSYPNIMYETFNEPLEVSWSDNLKPYHEEIIKTIRVNDPNNVIIVGTPSWSQRVDLAAEDPITDQKDIMYTLHFYAGTHKQWLRDTAQSAIDDGLPIFVSSYSTVDSTADGPVDAEEAQLWWDWLDENNISYVNYELSDIDESTSALVPGTTADDVCQEEFLSESGLLVVEQNKS